MKRRKNPSKKSLLIPLAVVAGGAYLLMRKSQPMGSLFTDIRDQAETAVTQMLPPSVQALIPGAAATPSAPVTPAPVAVKPAVPAAATTPGAGINPLAAGGAVIGIPLLLGLFNK